LFRGEDGAPGRSKKIEIRKLKEGRKRKKEGRKKKDERRESRSLAALGMTSADWVSRTAWEGGPYKENCRKGTTRGHEKSGEMRE
jgi:hypothetical protein